MNPQKDNCCAHDKPHHKAHGKWATAAHSTLHCLTGCVIGEFAGLAIGVTFGFTPYAMMALSTLLAYLSGFSLTVFPLMRKTGLSFKDALKGVWLGEIISIGVMELIMNSIDYHMGGVRSGSVANLRFWKALISAAAAGYLAALPVNAWLIGKQLKKCH